MMRLLNKPSDSTGEGRETEQRPPKLVLVGVQFQNATKDRKARLIGAHR